MRTVAEIDALIAADKALFGEPAWSGDGAVAKLVSPVIDHAGLIIGGLVLYMAAMTETAEQRGNAALVLDDRPVQRLSFRPGHAHVNPPRHPTPPALRLLTLPPGRSRMHGWRDNRVWPRLDNVATAALMEPEPPTISAAFALFLETCGISAYIPPPPSRPRLEL